jgi:hypothetical protein
MKELTMNTLRHHTVDDLAGLVPAMIYVNGEPKFCLTGIDDVIIVGDLHPHMQKKLKGLVARARLGMPPSEKVWEKPRESKKPVDDTPEDEVLT